MYTRCQAVGRVWIQWEWKLLKENETCRTAGLVDSTKVLEDRGQHSWARGINNIMVYKCKIIFQLFFAWTLLELRNISLNVIVSCYVTIVFVSCNSLTVSCNLRYYPRAHYEEKGGQTRRWNISIAENFQYYEKTNCANFIIHSFPNPNKIKCQKNIRNCQSKSKNNLREWKVYLKKYLYISIRA